ncbi:MAG: tetratricopeptide repeat protein [Sphingomicrobium sp.]
MALPPDTGETFLREVDENLRRDQARDFLKSNGKWIIAGLIVVLAAIGAWIYWQTEQKRKGAEQTEELGKIYHDIGEGRTQNAASQLDAVAGSRQAAVRASALFTRAALALQNNDRPTAVAKYAQIAGDESLPEPYRDLANIRQTSLEFDSLKPEQVIARMQPLSKAGEPWFGSAGELTAMALLKQGRKTEAGKMFAAIAADNGVPTTIRSRAVQIAGTLGVDASASLPTIEQGR